MMDLTFVKNFTSSSIQHLWSLLTRALVLGVMLQLAFSGECAAGNPAKREDAAAEREKILSTADKIEVVETNLELTRTELNDIKAEIERLKTENAALKAALEKSEQTRLKEREVLLEEVGKMIAANNAAAKKGQGRATSAKAAGSTTTAPKASQAQGDGSSGTGSEKTASDNSEKPAATEKPSRPKPAADTGFNHVVQKGQTLALIAQAFREQGVNVTVDDIVKANDLPSREIKPGQKLFIPKK